MFNNNTFSVIGLGIGCVVGAGLLKRVMSNTDDVARTTYFYTTSIIAWAYAGEMYGSIFGLY